MEGRRSRKKPVKRRSERKKERRSRTGREWSFYCTSTPQEATEQDTNAECTHLELSLSSSLESGGVCRKQSGSSGEVSLTWVGKLVSQKNDIYKLYSDAHGLV